MDPCSSASNDLLEDYESMFRYQQKQNARENEMETVELEDQVFQILDDDLVITQDTEDGELELKIDLDDDDNLSDNHNYFEPVNDGASVSFHDLAVLLITLKTTFNIKSISLSFVLKIIFLVVTKERRNKLLSIKPVFKAKTCQCGSIIIVQIENTILEKYSKTVAHLVIGKTQINTLLTSPSKQSFRNFWHVCVFFFIFEIYFEMTLDISSFSFYYYSLS